MASFDAEDIDTHSRLTVIAMRSITSRFHGNHEARQKAGRVLSERNRQRIGSLLEQWEAVSADLKNLLSEAVGATNDTEKRARDTEYFMQKYRYSRQ